MMEKVSGNEVRELKDLTNQSTFSEKLDNLTKGIEESDIQKTEKFIPEETKLDNVKEKLLTRNGELAGKTHPLTGVPFEKKTVQLENKQIEGVFPKFESTFDANLKPENYKKSDLQQFKEANQQLKDKVEENPEFRAQFNDDQYLEIMDNEIPEDYTWHHSEEPGKLELVDSLEHAWTGHTGGRNIWGGGSEAR
jgi:hypothetical protein